MKLLSSYELLAGGGDQAGGLYVGVHSTLVGRICCVMFGRSRTKASLKV
jgi:hypothetical protein